MRKFIKGVELITDDKGKIILPEKFAELIITQFHFFFGHAGGNKIYHGIKNCFKIKN